MSQAKRDNLLAANKTRVQGVTGDQTIVGRVANLMRIIVANADVAVQTLTVKDGGTTLVVLRIAAGGCATFELGIPHATSIVVNPSSANIDALVIYD